MNAHRRRLVQIMGAALLAGGGFGSARARSQELAKIIVGFPPGSVIDAAARRVAEKLTPTYARAAVVDNRVGVGGQLAVSAMKTLPADGSALLITPMSILGVYPHTYRKLPYDPIADLTPVSQGVIFDYGFAVGTAVPDAVKTVPDFMSWCKANPGKASIGSPATGSTLHFTGIMLGRAAGVNITHVGYRGSQAAVLDVIGGQLPALVSPLGELIRHLPGGKLRLLATSGANRSRFTANVTTLVEQGFRDFAFSEWFGFYLPGKAAADVVARTNTALRGALGNKEVIDGLAVMGLEARSSTPAELAALLKADSEKWGPIVKAIGFTAES